MGFIDLQLMSLSWTPSIVTSLWLLEFQGEDLGPMELKIESIQKQIVTSVDECNQMQQFWLRQQNDLVKKTKSSEEQKKAIDSLEKQLLIMNQKKIRIDGNDNIPWEIISIMLWHNVIAVMML